MTLDTTERMGPMGASESASSASTEDRIFEAALRVFARKGRDGARMQEIADAAEINKAMLHYYFRDKASLYEAVFDYVFGQIVASFGEAMEEADSFEATLRAFVDGYVEFVSGHLDVMRLMVNEMLAGAPVLRERARRFMHESERVPPRRFLVRLQQAVERGEVRAVDPAHTMVTVIAACVFSLLAHPLVVFLFPEGLGDRTTYVEARKAHVFDVLYHGLKPRTEEE